MEDQIIGLIFGLGLFAIVGFASYKKRRYGENPSNAKYSKGRK